MAHQLSLETSENRVLRQQGIEDRVSHLEEERGGLRNRSDPQDTDECRLYGVETVGNFSRREETGEKRSMQDAGTFNR